MRLKHAGRGTIRPRGYGFQTNPREVEASGAMALTLASATFQTNPREVEAIAVKRYREYHDPFQTNPRGVEAKWPHRDDVPGMVSDEPSWG